jgi:hypothetical protein
MIDGSFEIIIPRRVLSDLFSTYLLELNACRPNENWHFCFQLRRTLYGAVISEGSLHNEVESLDRYVLSLAVNRDLEGQEFAEAHTIAHKRPHSFSCFRSL